MTDLIRSPVFMIGWEFPPHNSGGLGVACQGITNSLIEQGQSVVFALPQSLPSGGAWRRQRVIPANSTPSKKNSKNSKHKSDDFPSAYMEMIQVNAQLKPYWRSGQLGSVATGNLVAEANRYGEVVAQVASHENYKSAPLLHAHDWMSIPAGLKARDRVKKPLVLHIHSTEFDRTGGEQPNQQIADIEWQGMMEADKIVAVSHYTKQLIINKYGIDSNKIEVVHNGVDPNPQYHEQPLSNFLSNRPVVVFVGRLTIQKGPEYFLTVAKRVLEQQKEAVFVLAGQGDQYESLLVSSAFQGLSSSVLFAGFLRGKEKELLYQRADVFVMPSVSEPFGIVALEAALAKTPVIASKNSGVVEVLPQAEVIDFWDIDQMTDSILQLLKNQDKRRKVGEALQKEAEQVTWSRSAQKLRRLYDELLGQ